MLRFATRAPRAVLPPPQGLSSAEVVVSLQLDPGVLAAAVGPVKLKIKEGGSSRREREVLVMLGVSSPEDEVVMLPPARATRCESGSPPCTHTALTPPPSPFCLLQGLVWQPLRRGALRGHRLSACAAVSPCQVATAPSRRPYRRLCRWLLDTRWRTVGGRRSARLRAQCAARHPTGVGCQRRTRPDEAPAGRRRRTG